MGKVKFSPEYKARLVLECLREEKTVSEIAAREGISRVQLQNWKKEFTENAARVFSQSKDEREAQRVIRETQERERDLMAKVGQLTVEADWLKKKSARFSQRENILSDPTGRLSLVTISVEITIKRQCELLGVNRTSVYYEPKKPTKEAIEREEHIKSRIDYWHTKMSYLGVRRLCAKMREEDGIESGRKLVKRYMAEMGIYCVYPKPNLSKCSKEHKKFPYLLKNKSIFLPNQVWAIDITYIKMGKSHMYLTAIIDWYSRYIVGWELSDSLDTAPVIEALRNAIKAYGTPSIINSDQGSQFTSDGYIGFLKDSCIRQSMDGRARWVDNVIIERWFRSLKCDNIYVSEYNTPKELRHGIKSYIQEYNNERPHSGIGNKYPVQVYKSVFAA